MEWFCFYNIIKIVPQDTKKAATQCATALIVDCISLFYRINSCSVNSCSVSSYSINNSYRISSYSVSSSSVLIKLTFSSSFDFNNKTIFYASKTLQSYIKIFYYTNFGEKKLPFEDFFWIFFGQ